MALLNNLQHTYTSKYVIAHRYYSNLRQELPPATDTVYRHRNYPRGITPQEIQGLQAVLAVVRAVAGNNYACMSLTLHLGHNYD
jgi:nuclear pore complex protein Nup205